eukprot:TRINITY_DN11008_c0_g1_i1.p1 TRINITY_DN11008_c0_g1~~TRINITY_DN11008_c0_g1_i1.p1  ORF type:complete len:857 (+),score=187.90 TRINITY_DN11008_c0_g1_i1:110-2680(+)
MEDINEKKRKIEDDESEVHHPHKKRRIEFDLSANVDLPAEIMLEIFEKLSPVDFKSSLEVCKYWYDCSSTFLGWTFVGSADYALSLKSDEIPAYEALLANIPHTSETKTSYQLFYTNYLKPFSVRWINPKLELVNEQLTAGPSVSFAPNAKKVYNAIEEYLRDNESVHCPEWRIEAHAYSVNNSRAQITTHSVVFKLYVNVKALEASVLQDKPFPKVDVVFKYGVNQEVTRVIAKEGKKFKELKEALMPYMPPKIEPPKGLKEGFKWHRYQLECISWMKSIEDNIDKEFKYCDLTPWRASRANLLFDLHNEKILTPEAVNDYIGTFKSHGGVLADAVGLGKTLELIGLTLATQDKKLPEFDSNGLFNTKASLIICSSHIALQWASEIAKFTDLKVTQLTTIKEATEVTYGDIVNSDFVIVASPLLKNKPFLSLGCAKAIVSLAPKALKTRADYLEGHLEEVKKKKNKLQVTGPPLDNFHFRRIIVDEAHELFLDNFTLALLVNQAKDYCWYVSATPFPSEGLLEATKKFLGIWAPDLTLGKTTGDLYENYVENDLVMNNLVWRNTKESIQDEYDVPDYEEEVVWIDCHPIESLYYKNGNSTIDYLTRLNSAKDQRIYMYENKLRTLRIWPQTNSHLLQAEHRKLEEWKHVPYVLTQSTPKKDEERLKMLDEHGSKLVKMVEWLKGRIEEDDSNRFLFFSQSNSNLYKLSSLLKASKISFVRFDGNVNQKAKVLKEFKEEHVKVMLLSLVKSASGLNLIEANYIVLMDPMSGSVEQSRAYELQALGRSHRQGQDQKVKLMRFVLKDTFEEELYNRNKSSGRESDDKKKSLLKRSGSAIQLLNRSASAESLRQMTVEK